MGQLSLLFVVAAFLISGLVIFGANQSADRADEKVWEHQYHVIARDAASTGMAATARKLANSLNLPWNATLANNLSATDVEYNGGTYSVTAVAHSSSPSGTEACSILNTSNYQSTMALHSYIADGDIIEVQATGTYEGPIGSDTEQSHQLVGCYMRADWSLFAPPAFNYGFISEEDITFNGVSEIEALVDGEGHIHTNGTMTLKKNVRIDGHATYVDGENIKNEESVVSHGTGSSIPLATFDADQYAIDNEIPDLCVTESVVCRYDLNGYTASTDEVIKPFGEIDPDRRKSHPYIWYIDGTFDVSGGQIIQLPQYTTIVVNGQVKISGNSSIGTNGLTTDNYETIEDWARGQMFDEPYSPLAWYVQESVTIGGTSGLIGNFYANGDITMNGTGNTAGSFASTSGTIDANGGGQGSNFLFLEVAEENVTEGVKLPGKQIVRLAIAEWTDPVLDAAP